MSTGGCGCRKPGTDALGRMRERDWETIIGGLAFAWLFLAMAVVVGAAAVFAIEGGYRLAFVFSIMMGVLPVVMFAVCTTVVVKEFRETR